MNDHTTNVTALRFPPRPTCPRHTPWCVDHQANTLVCISTAISGGRAHVWLMQEVPGIEPIIVVDAPPSGAELSLTEATDLTDAIQLLRQAAMYGTEVQR